MTRALGLQWSCPVLPLEFHDPESLSPVMPRLFVDAFGAFPCGLLRESFCTWVSRNDSIRRWRWRWNA